MLRVPRLDSASTLPLYKQLYSFIKSEIEGGILVDGERLPPTRELSIQIGLNRATVSAAYALLEQDGLLRGHVGRGSFVSFSSRETSVDAAGNLISFSSSRPADDEFPISEFQATVREVLASAELHTLLQLGSTSGFGPLRRFLLDQARGEGAATADDDILITNGCQQALDLIQRVLAAPGSVIVSEDPVYHGAKNVFTRSGLRLIGVPVGEQGIDSEAAVHMVAVERAALLLVTPNFQNPTGTSLPLGKRTVIAEAVSRADAYVIENDIYGDLRYAGEPLPTIKQLNRSSRVLLVRSFSKLAFPGLRVGWVIGPKAVIARLTEAKQWCDLHTDQLSQAVLLRFAETGRLYAHRDRVRSSGAARLAAALAGCERYLPAGSTWTRPQGGMNLWVRLPKPLDAADMLQAALRDDVSYLPGSHFAVSRSDPATLRLSFGALSPERIEIGLGRLGRIFRGAVASANQVRAGEPAPAIV